MRSLSLWWDKLFLFLGLMKSRQSFSPTYILSQTVYRDVVQRESKRVERAGRPCRILLVYHTNSQGLVVPLGAELIDKVFSLLSRNCRDTDYIGWYQQGHIVGVLLTTLQQDSIVDGCKTLQARLVDCLCDASALPESHSLQVHTLNPDDLSTFMAMDCFPSSPVQKD